MLRPWLNPKVALVGLCLMVLPLASRAGVIVARNNWNLPGLDGWKADLQPWITLSNPGSGGITNSGYLRIDLPASVAPEQVPAEVTTPAANLFAGTWNTNMWIEFDFWTQYDEPLSVQVLWGSTNDTERYWADTVFDYNTDTMSTQAWTRLTSASFMNFTDWGGWHDQQTFLDDLAAIDWIGVYVERGGTGVQGYGIDDFNLMVPEPSEVAVLAVALLAACGTAWRTRRRGGKPLPPPPSA